MTGSPRLTRAQMLDLPGPALILTDNLTGCFPWLIRRWQRGHAQGLYQHALWLESAGSVVSQDWRCTRYRLAEYLTGHHRVKMVVGRRWSDEDRAAIRKALIAAVRHGGRYNWPGILGKAIGWPGLGWPGRQYCSEFAGAVLRLVDQGFMTPHPTPSDINAYTKGLPHIYGVAGVYDPHDD